MEISCILVGFNLALGILDIITINTCQITHRKNIDYEGIFFKALSLPYLLIFK